MTELMIPAVTSFTVSYICIYSYSYYEESCSCCHRLSRKGLMDLRYTPHSYSSTKLPLNVLPADKPVRLAPGLSQWWQNNGPIWIKWPVLAEWCCAALSKETAWRLWLASHNGSGQAIAIIFAMAEHDWHSLLNRENSTFGKRKTSKWDLCTSVRQFLKEYPEAL